jgi:uncharacterized repeat protein (TIGR03803 family)
MRVSLSPARKFVTSSFNNRLFFLSLTTTLVLWPASRSAAQTLNALHQFAQTRTNELFFYTNRDGAFPEASVVLSGRTLYGTTVYGGPGGWGSVFSVNIDGTGFTNLVTFSFDTSPVYTNADGGFPQGGLLLSGKKLYGTTDLGGSSGYGTIFSMNLDGTGFTNLHNFDGSDGSTPSGLVITGNTLYGTTVVGGSFGSGTLFKISTYGTGFTNIYNFTTALGQSSTNTDGYYPQGNLILSGKTLFGTTESGGKFGNGTVFRVNTNGKSFANLHNFSALSVPFSGTNEDGARLYAGLTLSGNTLYGVTYGGGNWGDGALFAIQTDGLGFTNLHNFAGYLDGATPEGQLLLAGNTLYGTASVGGYSGAGTVFAINTDGTGYTNAYTFSQDNYDDDLAFFTNHDGFSPFAGLILSSNTLYGTGNMGGNWGAGTVFSLSFPPKLAITLSGSNAILSWPANFAGFNYAGFALQSATNLDPSPVWTTVSPPSVIVHGQNTVTNSLYNSQRFYRLSR